MADAQKLARDLEDNKTEQYQLLRQMIDRVEVGNDHFLFKSPTFSQGLANQNIRILLLLESN